MKKQIIYLLAAGMIFGTACQKNFLDRFPQTEIAPDLFFKSEDDLSEYINGLLDHPGSSRYFSDQSSDNLATTANVEVKNIMTGTPTSKNISSGWSWGRLRNINYFLENYNRADVEQEVKDHYVGLARYYRATFYMGMVKRYSDVPWYGSTIDPSDSAALYMGRTPRAEVMDSVIADLAFAASHVREDVPAGTPGKWAVTAMYARIALYEGTFRKYHPELQLQSTADRFLDTAIEAAGRIMESGNYHVYSSGNPDRDYAALFNSPDLENNPEVILNTPYDLNVKGAPSFNINSTVFGDYEQSPSRDLVQAYLMKDGSSYTDQPGYQTFEYVQEFKDRDPRMAQTLVAPGFKRVQDASPYIARMNKNFTGYHQLKGYINSMDNVEIGSTDFAAIRYGEVLLTYAEALAEKGTVTQADLDQSINLLRDRVSMPHLELAAANAQPDPVLSSKYPDVTGANKGVILEIRRERRIELALEGYRYDDLMRWNGGALLAKIPEGMYFPGLGQYDMTGDGIPDIMLIDADTQIPAEADKVKNSLGVTLVYYNAGNFNDDVTVYLREGNKGTLVTEVTPRKFIAPKYYYRPIPYLQTQLNTKLTQIFGWE